MSNEEKVTSEPETEVQEAAEALEPEQSGADTDTAALLEEARNKADENWNMYMRGQAELENLRKRAEKDLENAHKYALEKFANELLPVKDSLELGLAAVEENQDEAVAKLKEGTELTLKMLSSAMEKFGIAEINPEGEAFNPEQHQAMTMQESAEAKPNTVLSVMQKGYSLNERVIRPALVVVAKAPTQ
ncbi:MAG: nucleotide exchange factor GrpE [Gammaproteobacteria bacterium]|nr:nucleotide exchange factor GrpE [Gammaproteobacteria bacterium]